MPTETQTAQQWREAELTFTAERSYEKPYLEVEAWVEFTSRDGLVLRRPAFWDGGSTFRVRFAPPEAQGSFTYRSYANVNDAGLVDRTGTIECVVNEAPRTRFERHGFWRMSPGKRSLVHADGAPALLVADTAWALPFRATLDECRTYAEDRRRKGFNAALLMTVQPDMDARGPRSRTDDDGFDVGFEDLPNGHLNELNLAYFQHLDALIACLVEHGIAAVLQPVFHGYGWKGLRVAGSVISPDEYARYCRYLVARYGARPAVYLIGADGLGDAPGLDAGGSEVERWDAYEQPTGMHYAPHARNDAFQDRDWLDFQWCQTGHNGEHLPERVTDMRRNLPIKAVANGEPTYEHIGQRGRGAGFWQAHEAWSNLCAGGTMGVVYGAGSLWQWRRHANEPGHLPWCMAEGAGWREALEFEGSTYVGLVARILEGLPTTDMEPDYTSTHGRRGLAVEGKLLVNYLESGGSYQVIREPHSKRYRVVDPRTGETTKTGELTSIPCTLDTGTSEPRLVIFSSCP
jgi:hypothetical protein